MDCGVNFLDVFGARTDERQKLQHFCGSVADRFNSPENVVHVRFFAQKEGLNSRFSLNSTAFRNKGDTEVRCAQGEFDCDDGVCLHESLQCNGYSNCKFNWDEEGCAKKNTGPPKFATSHILAIMVIGCLLLAGMCILMLFNCFYKLRKDRREYRERRSLERSLHGSVVSTPSGSRRLGLQGTSISKTRLSRIHSLSEDDGVFCIPDPPPRPNGGILMSPIPSSGSRLTLTRESGVQTPGSSSTCPSDEEGSSLPQFSCGLSESSDERLLILGRGELYIPPTPTPPPPPPPIGNFGRHGSSALNNPGSRRASTTHSTRTLPATMPHYRAEAVIEVSERPRRSHSGMSFSSAPDVIVLH
ncbi:unnamed protein product [Darwinula stevensoni]|uniref:Uncharacterized protein n=1 Tax=Darwinula stevensoni TaxID=69355 RepID=A0A7R8XDM4_9CRUS|nr:unnamed protein product [Darwinula stevensoni]CAG0888839.1 unnamed protein product [Darwinula stevensoni]